MWSKATGKVILVIGGSSSGKSEFAVKLAKESRQKVVFIATAEAGDAEMRHRIEAHKRSRPQAWQTVEEPLALSEKLAGLPADKRFVIVDCITLWVSNMLISYAGETPTIASSAKAKASIQKQTGELIDALSKTPSTVLFVSNEVGSGIIPMNVLSRAYAEALGVANKSLAERADVVYHMVAGIPVKIKG